MKKVVCAISGGVDSAVSAYLLKQRGYETLGLFMKNWDISEENGMCTNHQDAFDAYLICQKIGIPFYEVNFIKEYWNDVFSELVRGYAGGKTPNPDVLCNKQIKFGHFIKFAIHNIGADAIATGHYAKNSWGQFLHYPNFISGAKLLKANDETKDQTLFLSQISQSALQKTMFPIGNYKKTMVKRIASDIGLGFIANKKESTGICFIGKRNFQNFLREYLPINRGYFVDVDDNKIVGEHEGIHLWTIGQRAMIPGMNKAYFVVQRNPNDQSIIVAKGTLHPALFSDTLSVRSIHWIDEEPQFSSGVLNCQFRFQHSHIPIDCRIMKKNLCFDVHLSKRVRAIAPGQCAAFYLMNECLGSAVIDEVY